jgi:ATP-dependent Clp protease protease subunit
MNKTLKDCLYVSILVAVVAGIFLTINLGAELIDYVSTTPSLGDKLDEPQQVSTVEEPKVAPTPRNQKPATPRNLQLTIPPVSSIPLLVNASFNRSAYPVVTLHKANTLVFRDIVSAKSMGVLQQKLFTMSNRLPANEPIYLVLNTPGGSIDAGTNFIDSVKALKRPVITITLFAASMGFHIVENLDSRWITPNGTLMSHRAAISGLEGQVPGEAITRLNFILRQVTILDELVAKRVGMRLKDYQNLVRDEYWVTGDDAVEERMADKVVLAQCSSDLDGTYTQSVDTFFGAIKMTWSNCPLIMAPVEVDKSSIFGSNATADQKKAIYDFLETYIHDKPEFTLKYIINGSYKKILAD